MFGIATKELDEINNLKGTLPIVIDLNRELPLGENPHSCDDINFSLFFLLGVSAHLKLTNFMSPLSPRLPARIPTPQRG